MKMGFVAGLLMVVSILANLAFNPETVKLTRSIPMLFFGLFLVFLTTIFIPLSVRRAYARDKRLHEEFVADITDSGIGISSPNSRSQTNWSAFLRWFESKNLFVLYHSPQLFNTFPKRAFTIEQIEEFRSLLRQKLAAG
jgi:hypothetical protein